MTTFTVTSDQLAAAQGGHKVELKSSFRVTVNQTVTLKAISGDTLDVVVRSRRQEIGGKSAITVQLSAEAQRKLGKAARRPLATAAAAA